MTTARDVIIRRLKPPGGDGPAFTLREAEDIADAVLSVLLSADESVRLELAAKLNPWRLPTEAPAQEQWCICLLPPEYRTEGPLQVAQYCIDKWLGLGGEPLAWLPAPPSEDK